MPEPKHHQLEFRSDSIAVLTLDMLGKQVNLLTSEMVLELTSTVERLHAMREVVGLVIQSAKPKQFIAGADVNEIYALTDPIAATEKAELGQSLLNLLERLPFPSVACIDGPCLGGGLELALACTYRVAGEGTHVRFALPEVRLGIIPGFGGTQRLPLLIGLLPALDVIVSGRTLSAPYAYRIGLVDDLSASGILTDVALTWARKGLRFKEPRKLALWKKWGEKIRPVRTFFYKKARQEILASTLGVYPAPLAAIDVLEKTYRSSSLLTYEVEARKVGELIAHPVSKALMGFFLSTEDIRRTKFHVPTRAVHKVGVVGAGLMGAGIAGLLASKDKIIRLKDVTSTELARGLSSIQKRNEKDVTRKRLTAREAQRRWERISASTEWSGFGRTDFVIEAAIEDVDAKRKIFEELAAHVRPDTILATNTSSLSINEIASLTSNPERVIGMHFFNPVDRMQLVEIIRGEKTSPITLATTFELALALGKTPILVANRPGFLINRILGLYLNEACRAAEEGVSIALIDQAMKEFGMPMGPFELMDEIGLDIAEKVGLRLSEALRHFPQASPLLSTVRQSGRLGKKGGKGFYVHTSKTKHLDGPFIEDLLKRIGVGKLAQEESSAKEKITDRLVMILLNEGAWCLADQTVGSARDLDVGMILGTGFPPYRGGLVPYAKSLGRDRIETKLQQLAKDFGPHFRPGEHLHYLLEPATNSSDLLS